MKRFPYLLVLICACITLCNFNQVSALFSFSNPATEADDPLSDIENTEDRLEELADYVNSAVPSVLPGPSNGSAFKAVIVDNGGTTYNTSYAIRSNSTDVLYTGTATNGQYLRFNSASTASPVSITNPTRWTLKTSSFTTVDATRYLVTNGVNMIELHNPANGDEFWIKPEVGTTLRAYGHVMALNGAMQVGGVAANGVNLEENVEYHFIADATGTNYDVSKAPLDRSEVFYNGYYSKVKTSTTTVNNTTLAEDPQLQIVTATGKKYQWLLTGAFNAENGTGMKVIVIPGGTPVYYINTLSPESNVNGTALSIGGRNPSTEVLKYTPTAAAPYMGFVSQGTFTSTGGTFKIYYALNSGSGKSCSLMTGSSLTIREVE